MRTVYGIVAFKLSDGVPIFHEVGIYSEFPLARTPSSMWDVQLKAFEVEGSDYQEASRLAVEWIAKSPHWSWMLPHILKRERLLVA